MADAKIESQEYDAPVLQTTGIPQVEKPTGIMPARSNAGDTQCQCADCEGSDCGPNG